MITSIYLLAAIQSQALTLSLDVVGSEGKGNPNLIQVGEPLRMIVGMTNHSADRKLTLSLNPEDGQLTIFVGKAGEAPAYIVSPRWLRFCKHYGDTLLRNGQTITEEIDLLEYLAGPNRVDPIFAERGDYNIFVAFRDANHHVQLQSNTIRVQVRGTVPNWDRFRKSGLLDQIAGKNLRPAASVRAVSQLTGFDRYLPLLGEEWKPAIAEAPKLDDASALRRTAQYAEAVRKGDFAHLHQTTSASMVYNDAIGWEGLTRVLPLFASRYSNASAELNSVSIEPDRWVVEAKFVQGGRVVESWHWTWEHQGTNWVVTRWDRQ